MASVMLRAPDKCVEGSFHCHSTRFAQVGDPSQTDVLQDFLSTRERGKEREKERGFRLATTVAIGETARYNARPVPSHSRRLRRVQSICTVVSCTAINGGMLG